MKVCTIETSDHRVRARDECWPRLKCSRETEMKCVRLQVYARDCLSSVTENQSGLTQLVIIRRLFLHRPRWQDMGLNNSTVKLWVAFQFFASQWNYFADCFPTRTQNGCRLGEVQVKVEMSVQYGDLFQITAVFHSFIRYQFFWLPGEA